MVDVIVVGSGLTGSWAAKELASAGLKVLVLDAGPLLSTSSIRKSVELSVSQRRRLSIRQQIQRQHSSYWKTSPLLFVDDVDNPYVTLPDEPFTWIRGRQVGGRAHTWGGVLLRMSDYEFLASSFDNHGPCWPLCYADLKPFYDEVERFLKVVGTKEGLPQLPDGVYNSASKLNDTEAAFKVAIEASYPSRKVIPGRGIRLASSPSNTTARPSITSVISSAIRTGNVVVSPDSIVTHLLLHNSGKRLRGVCVIDQKTYETRELEATAIVLCASTIESVRILLSSTDKLSPQGLGNSSGLLGRYLMDHMAVWITGFVEGSHSMGGGTRLGGPDSIVIPKFCNVTERFDDVLRGFGIWGGLSRGRTVEGEADGWFLHALCEVLPEPENVISLEKHKVDRWGVSCPSISLRYSSNEARMREEARRSMEEMCSCAGLHVHSLGTTSPGQYVHELGGARMGSEKRNSVVNSFGQCWDAPNLFVLDGASFPTSGWQNPSLTMMAFAVRGARYLASVFDQIT